MKLRNLVCFILITSLCSLQCRKYEGPPTELPPITQEGKNTFGCKIDGKIWVPYYSCRGFSANPCGELFSHVFSTNGNATLPLSINMNAAIKTKDNSFSAFSIQTGTNEGIFDVGNKIDSITLSYLSPTGHLYENS